MDVSNNACPTCGKIFTGKFCAACGEKQSSVHDFSVGHFVEESVEGFTHFDNKFIRTIRQLLFKPGMLTLNFEQGRKIPFMKPMQLFIICNLLFFLLVGGANIFAVQLSNYLATDGGHVFKTRSYFFEKFGTNADIKYLSEIFREKMISQSKMFIVLFIPFFSLTCILLFLRRRKPFGLHLAFATHFFSFLLLFFTLFHLLIELPNDKIFHFSSTAFNQFATILNFSVLVIYFTLAARRFYKVRWIWSGLTGLAAGIIFIILLQAYRLFLFYNILRTLD